MSIVYKVTKWNKDLNAHVSSNALYFHPRLSSTLIYRLGETTFPEIQNSMLFAFLILDDARRTAHFVKTMGHEPCIFKCHAPSWIPACDQIPSDDLIYEAWWQGPSSDAQMRRLQNTDYYWMTAPIGAILVPNLIPLEVVHD